MRTVAHIDFAPFDSEIFVDFVDMASEESGIAHPRLHVTLNLMDMSASPTRPCDSGIR